MNLKEKYKLRRLIIDLEKVRGRHTELVSVYIPVGYDIIKIIHHLMEEQGTAENIKDKTNRMHVIDSIEKMIQHLKLFKRTPDNGLAVFSGNFSDKEGKADIRVFSIEPPEPMNLRVYRCDQTFLLDPLKQMVEIKETYGLIVLDRREANIGLLKGTNIEELCHKTSNVPGKTTKGGQCLDPEVVVNTEKSYKKLKSVKVGDILKAYNFKNKKLILTKCINVWKVKKNLTLYFETKDYQIIASPDHIFFKSNKNIINEVPAEELKIGDYLINYQGKNTKIQKIRKISSSQTLIDIETDKKNFIANDLIVHNSQQRYARLREEAAHEFFKRVAEDIQKEFLNKPDLKGILIGGPGPTKEDFISGNYLNTELKKKIIAVKDLSYTGSFGLHELLDKSQDVLAQEEVMIEKQIMQKFFEIFAKEESKVTYGKDETIKALQLGAIDTLLLSESLDVKEIEDFELEADKFRTEVRIISTETREGKQLKDLGGVAAILRYPLR